MEPRHHWEFVRVGGLDQVLIRDGEDLRHLKELDQKLWVALSSPVNGLELDEATLKLIDQDNDGRIRVPEILAAIEWSAMRLKTLDPLLSGVGELALNAINDKTAEGQAILASAKTVLASIGKEGAAAIQLSDAVDRAKLVSSTTLNGDGVITEATAEDDDEVKQVIRDIIATVGSVNDSSGVPGVDQAKTDTFFNLCASCIDWLKQGESPDVLTLGEATASVAAAINAVRVKVDDYFARTRLAAFDERALSALNLSESKYLDLVAQDLSVTADEVAGFPLAKIEPGKPLPLLEAVNPAWANAIAMLHRVAVTPVFGKDTTSLTEEQWTQLKDKTARYDAWLAGRNGNLVEKLGPERIREIIKGGTHERLNALITADKALESEFKAVHSVEQLIRYCRDFRKLLNNFVNFLDFYSPDKLSTFQAGTLYLDNRSTELCIQVSAVSPLAAMSKTYIAYCDCTRKGHPPMKIAACFTQGDSDYLFVGRNGVFYDRKGRDWDANITAVVDNPISVLQAFFLPYKKFVRKIEEHAAKRAAAAEAKADAQLDAAAARTTDMSTPVAAAPAQPQKKLDIGVVAALGVAISGAITALTLILGYIFGLAYWQYPLVLLGLVVVISGPSMLIAWLKLRQRTVGPILEANGWAINGRVKIGVSFGTRLTERAKRPQGSRYSSRDPYTQKRSNWWIALWAGLAIAVLGALAYWDARRHDGLYFWQTPPTVEAEEGPAAAPAADAAPAATP